MSHHTGARLTVFPSHTMESTKWTRQAIAVQTPYMYVPTFRDPRCHQRGMTDKMNPIPENTVNTVLETVMEVYWATAGGVGSTANDLGLYTSRIKRRIYNEGTCMTIIIYLVTVGAKCQAVSLSMEKRLGDRVQGSDYLFVSSLPSGLAQSRSLRMKSVDTGVPPS